ncbi:MAG: hypothetical protein ACFCVK_08060 [Acidimicrobiales bacterium]
MSWLSGRSLDGGLDHLLVDGDPTGIWLGGKHLVGPGPDAALERIGAEPAWIVCLCEPHEVEHRYPDYVAWLGRNEGRRSLWRPIPDLTAPPMTVAETIAAEIAERLDAGHHVLVHCGAGMGRAPTMAICALAGRGHGIDTLLEAVASSRPMAGPENGAQLELVHRFARAGP